MGLIVLCWIRKSILASDAFKLIGIIVVCSSLRGAKQSTDDIFRIASCLAMTIFLINLSKINPTEMEIL